MALAIAFVISEAFDFALDHPLYICCVAVLSFYAGLEGRQAMLTSLSS